MVPTGLMPCSVSRSFSAPLFFSTFSSSVRSDCVDQRVTSIWTTPAPLPRLLLTIATAVNRSFWPSVCECSATSPASSTTISRDNSRVPVMVPSSAHVPKKGAAIKSAVAMTMTQAPVAVAEPTRISSIDIVRGAVLMLMAMVHVGVYSVLPAGGPTAEIFSTRWVTPFCAPAFIFLAGTSAFMSARRHDDVSRFLMTRGLWLMLLELTVVRVAWTFDLEFMRYNLAGVIWVIGWCMVLLALLVRLPLKAVAAFGLVVMAGHNVLDSFPALAPGLAESELSGLWNILYLGFSAG